MPITYPENADALVAWLRDAQQWVTLRVPYPMGAMFTKKVKYQVRPGPLAK